MSNYSKNSYSYKNYNNSVANVKNNKQLKCFKESNTNKILKNLTIEKLNNLTIISTMTKQINIIQVLLIQTHRLI